jgi:hypothetical protein
MDKDGEAKGKKDKKAGKTAKKSDEPEIKQEPEDTDKDGEVKVKKEKKEKKDKVEKKENEEEKKKKRKASELETETPHKDSESKAKKKVHLCISPLPLTSQKKSKNDTNEDSSVPAAADSDDTPMPDITTLLLPDLIPTTNPIPSTAETTSIHPSRMRNFTNTDTFAAVDPSFLPRKKDIQRARKELDRSLHPPPPKHITKKLTLAEKRAKRAAKKAKRYEEPKPFVRKELVATREPIDDALEHLLQEVGSEGKVLSDMVAKCKVDVRDGGRLLNVNRELYARLGLKREGVQEDGTGGQIVVSLLPRKIRARDLNGNNVEARNDDDDDDSD